MCSSKPVPYRAPQRRLYEPPTLTKMTAEEAEVLLKSKALPGDREGEELLQIIKAKRETNASRDQQRASTRTDRQTG